MTRTSSSALGGAFDAHFAQSLEALRQGHAAQALALMEPWAAHPQRQAPALQIMGIALMRLGLLARAQDCLARLVQIVPGDTAAWTNLSNVQAALGRTAEALDSLGRVLALAPMEPAAHFNRGNLLMQAGQAEAACASFRRAAELAPGRPDPGCNLAGALLALGRHDEAIQILQREAARHPALAAVWNLLGMAWHQAGDHRQALQNLQKALACEPPLPDAYLNTARILAQQGHGRQARQFALRAVQLDSNNASAVQMLRTLMAGSHQADGAGWLEAESTPDGGDQHALGMLFELDMQRCDWTAAEQGQAALERLWSRGHWDGADSWRLLSRVSQAGLQRTIAEAISAQRHGAAEPWPAEHSASVYIGQARPARLRIGYFSSDFHDHATAFLLAGMLELHDRQRFETVGYCLGSYPQGDDVMRQRVRAAFDRFEQVGLLDDAALVQRVREQGIHIAVDLKGHTTGSRMGLFARRLAPLQIHYLGYPGTLGMPGAIDYLLADGTVVPPHSQQHYSESIIALPDSYQVNDRQRRIDARVPDRAELGLPPDAFVFCCFNDTAKITREVFGVWMALLQRQPHSVLWLLAGHAQAEPQLREAAVAQGIAPQRLVFAPRVPLAQHLARHARADLFLDTWPCNAHTTASDALWAGLPVLTCAGETFASRVGASLLSACGLPQLVTHSPQDYLDQALELSSSPATLQSLRRQLQDTRLQVPLFDTERFTRHIEQAYDMAWERYCQGLAPAHFSVPPRA